VVDHLRHDLHRLPSLYNAPTGATWASKATDSLDYLGLEEWKGDGLGNQVSTPLPYGLCAFASEHRIGFDHRRARAVFSAQVRWGGVPYERRLDATACGHPRPFECDLGGGE
jgi:hypothetical protein